MESHLANMTQELIKMIVWPYHIPPAPSAHTRTKGTKRIKPKRRQSPISQCNSHPISLFSHREVEEGAKQKTRIPTSHPAPPSKANVQHSHSFVPKSKTPQDMPASPNPSQRAIPPSNPTPLNPQPKPHLRRLPKTNRRSRRSRRRIRRITEHSLPGLPPDNLRRLPTRRRRRVRMRRNHVLLVLMLVLEGAGDSKWWWLLGRPFVDGFVAYSWVGTRWFGGGAVEAFSSHCGGRQGELHGGVCADWHIVAGIGMGRAKEVVREVVWASRISEALGPPVARHVPGDLTTLRPRHLTLSRRVMRSRTAFVGHLVAEACCGLHAPFTECMVCQSPLVSAPRRFVVRCVLDLLECLSMISVSHTPQKKEKNPLLT